MKQNELSNLYEQYLNYYKNENYDEAIGKLKEYINICESSGIRGTYYYDLEKVLNSKMLSVFDKDTRKEILTLSKQFNAEYYTGKYDDALEICQEHYNLSKGNDLFACLHLGTFYLERGGLSFAKDYFNEALDLNEMSPRTYAKIVALNIKELNITKAQDNLKLLEKYDKNTHYYPLLFKYELEYLKGNNATLEGIVNKANRLLNDIELEKFNDKLNDFLSLNIEMKIKKEEKPKLKKNSVHIKNMAKFLEPDENNIVRPNLVDEYLNNLQLSDNDLGILQLETAKLLASYGYNDRADKLIRKTEKIKNKNDSLKSKLKNTHKELKLIKNR